MGRCATPQRLNNEMKKQSLKWLAASLIMPLLVIIFKSDLGGLVIVLWPGSIMLMSLGAESRPITDVIYIWSMAVGSNVLLYLAIGLVLSKVKLTDNEKT